jgi:F-type H+-transporting ATPase subunit gamma
VASLRELRRKVKSIKSTQQITKAMKLVAAARLNKAQERIVSARPFANKMELLLQELAYLSGHLEARHGVHPFFKPRESNRIDLVLVTADRGLCGGFNANLIRKALHYLRDNQGKDIRLWIIGRKGRDFFKRLHHPIEKEYVGIFQSLGFKQAELLGDDLIQSFLESGSSSVVFIYNEFKSRIQQKLTVKPLLPISEFEAVKPQQDFLYEPSREAILPNLLPRYIKAQIYRILLESQAAELAARMSG